ncbi:YihY/virulence factor BrkB family protein [Halomarina oriensis]|uniref:YihY/virulence factor BrkB family protein n=1 Tax=Halomarina oriensis TaxID=671145 RepID=A0A6B0GPW2_9EURY|nr:YihY/virulence factor BrkB family protein [Halomarina oriensis]MWG34703.1 YihY/virulence factor BrkB family protein [Halomarina oriensis]
MDRLVDGVELVETIVRVTLAEKLRYPAAALAYYAFVSFLPLLLLVFVAVGPVLATDLSRVAPQFLTPAVRQLVNQSIRTGTERNGAGVLAVLVVLWSAANFVGDVRTVVERVEGTVESTVRHWLRDAVVVLGCLGTAILAVGATSILFALRPTGVFNQFAAFVGLWVVLAVTFLPLYYVPSTVVRSPRAALPGAVVTSLGWTLVYTGIHFYAVNAGQYAVFGVLSGVVVIFTALYISASALLVGIVVNVAVATRRDDVPHVARRHER